MKTGLVASLVHVENQLVGLVIIDNVENQWIGWSSLLHLCGKSTGWIGHHIDVEDQLDADEEEVNFTSTRMYNLHFQQ